MSIKRTIRLSPVSCINPANGIEICPIDSLEQNTLQDSSLPLFSQETTVVTLEPGTIDELFVHKRQTDQLLVVKGCAVLVILENRQYQYIVLHECQPTVVTIPPGIAHGAINLTPEPCIAINSVLHHFAPSDRDYRPIPKPFPYDLEAVKAKLGEFNCFVNYKETIR